jgi:cation diffusion facilitator CzcD-associated flavoprotein CzcO
MAPTDVAIIGAGPYGLSTGAHLVAQNGLDVHVFGHPMSFWDLHMPIGMLLRSPLEGSHLSDPCRSLTLHSYQKTTGRAVTTPLPLAQFASYGRWFQTNAVPHPDRRRVELLERNGAGFLLTIENGETFRAHSAL